MIDIFAILFALGLLMYLAFRGVTLLILAPAMALFAALLTGGLPLLATYTQVFMTNTGDFIIAFFPLFMLGAIFGKLMDDSGAAKSIAHFVIAKLGPGRAIVSVVLCCGVLTYGGVSLFVVAFAIFPVAAALFRDAGIPKRLIPGTLALGAFTFTMSALPGTPAIQNAIPMPFFGTTAFAAPGLGIISGIIMFGLGTVWLSHRSAKARSAGEGYGAHEDSLPVQDVVMREHTQSGGFDINELPEGEAEAEDLPPLFLALAPVILVIAVNFAFVQFVVPMLDTSYLAEPRFGATTIASVRGVWAIIVSLFVASRRLADIQYRQPRRLWRRHRRAPRLRGHQRGSACNRRRQSAHFARGRGQCALGDDGVCVGWHEYRARRPWRYLCSTGRGHGSFVGGNAPCHGRCLGRS
jgi:H+/gluconate symporter-like permease